MREPPLPNRDVLLQKELCERVSPSQDVGRLKQRLQGLFKRRGEPVDSRIDRAVGAHFQNEMRLGIAAHDAHAHEVHEFRLVERPGDGRPRGICKSIEASLDGRRPARRKRNDDGRECVRHWSNSTIRC